MKCPTCEKPLVSFAGDDGSHDWRCVQLSCPSDDEVYTRDKHGNPVPKTSPLKLDDAIDFAFEILKSTPTTQEPQPGFWAEVLDLISRMDETIARSHQLGTASTNLRETSIQLELMRTALQRQCDKEMEVITK